jgi:hypothetical protein
MLKWLRDLFGPKPVRLELRLFTYDEANRVLVHGPGNWQIADEEDMNRRIGYVWLERRGTLTAGDAAAKPESSPPDLGR